MTDDGADRGADRASGTVDGPDQTPLERGLRWLRTVPATLVVSLAPGWVLAPLAHTPADPVHLVGNVVLLVVFGGMAERRLGVR